MRLPMALVSSIGRLATIEVNVSEQHLADGLKTSGFSSTSESTTLIRPGGPVNSSYDRDNIFARILRHEIPCHRVMEDDLCLAFMDIMPRAEGHCLVIPKAEARTLLDIDPNVLGEVIKRVQAVGRAAVQAFGEAAGGQEVFHLHFHILPRRAGIPLRPPGGPQGDPAALSAQAHQIADALRPH